MHIARYERNDHLQLHVVQGLHVHVVQGLHVHVVQGLHVHVVQGLHVHVVQGLHVHVGNTTMDVTTAVPMMYCLKTLP